MPRNEIIVNCRGKLGRLPDAFIKILVPIMKHIAMFICSIFLLIIILFLIGWGFLHYYDRTEFRPRYEAIFIPEGGFYPMSLDHTVDCSGNLIRAYAIKNLQPSRCKVEVERVRHVRKGEPVVFVGKPGVHVVKTCGIYDTPSRNLLRTAKNLIVVNDTNYCVVCSSGRIRGLCLLSIVKTGMVYMHIYDPNFIQTKPTRIYLQDAIKANGDTLNEKKNDTKYYETKEKFEEESKKHGKEIRYYD